MFQSAQPASELIALALLAPEVARQNLRELLLSNPDYFGRITGSSFKAVLKIEKDSTFETITGIHYNFHDETLEASIRLNRSMGYSGGKYGNASQEFVRFYLSYDEGSNWNDQGLYSFDAHDMKGTERILHTVSAGIHPALTFCFMQNLPSVRVILSWNSAPPANKPDWSPVWGEVLETKVEIHPSSTAPDDTRDEQADSSAWEKDLIDRESALQSTILERTIDTSRLKVLGLTELSEHYCAPNPEFARRDIGTS
jgi:hypothetical protein